MKRQYEIAATAASFDILSNKLYSNPALAVLRELSTNANDAHIKANRTELSPVLHLPREDENFFKIRDFGDGLSEEEIACIYCSFFVSTKSDDDSQTGYFGLGAKAPFAITDEFFVTSFQNGKKMVYRMLKENGIPTYELIEKSDTDEKDGIEILIKTFTKEFGSLYWESLAKNFFLSTSFLPQINLSSGDFDYLVQTRGFYQQDNISFQTINQNVLNVNVAGVSFTVSSNDLTEQARELYNALLSIGVKNINLMANKNDVVITPSREELQFTDETNTFLEKKFYEVVQNIDNRKLSIKEMFQLCSKMDNYGFDKMFPKTYNSLVDLRSRISCLSYQIRFLKNSYMKRLGYTTYYQNNFFCFDSYNYLLVDVNDISKSLRNSIDLIKNDQKKITVVYDYIVNYLKENDIQETIIILTEDYNETESILKEYNSSISYKKVKLCDMSKGEKKKRETSGKSWITLNSYIATKENYNLYKGSGNDFDFDKYEITKVVVQYRDRDACKAASFFHNLLRLVDTENQMVVVRYGDSEWCAQQVKSGKAIHYNDAIKFFQKKYHNELSELLVKREYNDICSQFSILTRDPIIQNFSDNFKNKPKIKKLLKILSERNWSLDNRWINNIELNPKQQKLVDDAKKLVSIEEKLLDKNPILALLRNNLNIHDGKIIADFIEKNF